MELLGERPAWSMNGSEALSSIDSIDAEIARLETARLPYVARVVETGHAEELGARNTAELLAFRHRMDPRKAHATVRLALALPKYAAGASEPRTSEVLASGLPASGPGVDGLVRPRPDAGGGEGLC